MPDRVNRMTRWPFSLSKCAAKNEMDRNSGTIQDSVLCASA